jgi:hypothetical protein
MLWAYIIISGNASRQEDEKEKEGVKEENEERRFRKVGAKDKGKYKR